MDSGKCGAHRCLECGEKILYGRGDKLFCSTECKNRYHYRRTKVIRTVRHRTERYLEKNHTILSGLIDEGLTEMDLSDLLRLGFRPEFATFFKKGKKYVELACFEIRYKLSESRIYGIERMKASGKEDTSERKID